MDEPGDDVDLAEEPLRAHRGGEGGVEDLDRDLPVVAKVPRQADHGHSTPFQLRHDLVPIGESALQSFPPVPA